MTSLQRQKWKLWRNVPSVSANLDNRK